MEKCNVCRSEISQEEFDYGMGECLTCFPDWNSSTPLKRKTQTKLVECDGCGDEMEKNDIVYNTNVGKFCIMCKPF